VRTREPAGAAEVFVSLFDLMPFWGWYKTCWNCAVLAAQKPENGSAKSWWPQTQCLVWGSGCALAPCPSRGYESSQGLRSVGGSASKHQTKAVLVFLCVRNTNCLIVMACTAVSLRSSPLIGIDSSAVYWKPRPVHEEEKGRLVGGPADEGAGQGGESQEAGERHLVQLDREPKSEMQMGLGRNSLWNAIKHTEQL